MRSIYNNGTIVLYLTVHVEAEQKTSILIKILFRLKNITFLTEKINKTAKKLFLLYNLIR